MERDVDVTGDVTLGPDATVLGNITGAAISIGGAVSGNVTGSEAVVLQASARVSGDLSAARIGIGGGALFRGNVATAGDPEVERPAAAPRPMRAAAPTPAPRAAAAPAKAPAPAAKSQAKKVARKAPPPVVTAPRKGRGKKKRGRR